jgi:hypothetical protein
VRNRCLVDFIKCKPFLSSLLVGQHIAGEQQKTFLAIERSQCGGLHFLQVFPEPRRYTTVIIM